MLWLIGAPTIDDIVHDMEDLCFGIRSEKGYACLSEVEKSLECGRSCEMSATMYDTFAFVAYPFYAAFYVLLEDANAPL